MAPCQLSLPERAGIRKQLQIYGPEAPASSHFYYVSVLAFRTTSSLPAAVQNVALASQQLTQSETICAPFSQTAVNLCQY